MGKRWVNIAFKMGRKLESRALKIFKTTNNPNDSGFITTTGKYLDFGKGYENIPDMAHMRVCSAYPKKIRKPDCENRYLSDTGDIRTQITRDNASFEIRKPLTQQQFDAVQNAITNRKVFIDYTDKNGGTIKSAQFDSFPEAKSWIIRNIH